VCLAEGAEAVTGSMFLYDRKTSRCSRKNQELRYVQQIYTSRFPVYTS
jgi:hypothetical protein